MANSGYSHGRPDKEYWLGQIRRGIKFRKTYAHEHRWNTWRNYYRGNWPRGVLPVNLFFMMLRTVVPRIYFRNPSISIQPTKAGPDQAAFAQLIERIDNKLMRTMGMKDQLKKITQQAWMFGTGIGKRGFAQEFKPSPGILLDGSSPDVKSNGTPVHRVEYHSNVMENMPWFLKTNTGDFIVPANTCEFEEARWYANWIRRPQFEVQNDPRLKGVRDIQTTAPGQSLLSGQVGGRNQRDTVDLVEIHDTMTQKVFVIAPYHNSGNNGIAYYEDDLLQTNNRPPFYKLVFNDDDEVMWGVPDSIVLEPQQLELNEIRTLEMKHRRLALLKLIYKKDTIETVQLEKLLDGQVLAAVEIKGELSDIDTFQVAEVPQSLIIQGREVMQDVREAMGFSRNQAGEYSEGRSKNPTATEANIVHAASEIRVDERRDMLADMIVNTFEDIHEDIFLRWKDEQVVQVMGPDNVPIWVAFKPEALKSARYELQVDPDTAVPETKAVRKNQAVQVYTLLKDNPLIDPEGLTKYLLRELHGVQYDNMMKSMDQLQKNASSGQPGATPNQPIQMEDYIRRLAAAGGKGPQAA